MDDPNITMEEYTRLEEEKGRRHGKVYNWEIATYGRIWDDDEVHNLRSVETEFQAIVFDDSLHLRQHSHVNLWMLMEHRDAQGHSVFTSRAWRRLFEIQGPLVHELILEFFRDSTSEVTKGALDVDEGDQAISAPVQAPQPLHAAGPARTMA
nr:hypothetical protein [Tanacetum cinerariifolium]